MSSLPANMKKILSKIAEKMWWHRFPHYKSMGFFSYAQGQLTLQSLVRSGRISNSSEMLWMFSLPASMKKIWSKMKALEWTQHFPHSGLPHSSGNKIPWHFPDNSLTEFQISLTCNMVKLVSIRRSLKATLAISLVQKIRIWSIKELNQANLHTLL